MTHDHDGCGRRKPTLSALAPHAMSGPQNLGPNERRDAGAVLAHVRRVQREHQQFPQRFFTSKGFTGYKGASK